MYFHDAAGQHVFSTYSARNFLASGVSGRTRSGGSTRPAGRPGGGAYTCLGRGINGTTLLKPAGSAFSRNVSRHCDSSCDLGMLAGASARPPPFFSHEPRISGDPSGIRLMGPAYFAAGVGTNSKDGGLA